MIRRPLSLALLSSFCLALGACSSSDNDFVAPPAATGDRAQVTPAGQAPAAPGAPAAAGTTHAYGATGYAAPAAAAAGSAPPPAPAAPAANEQIVMHTVVAGDSLWKLSRQYRTSVQRIKEVNGMATDDIFAGKTIKIPTTHPAAGAATTAAPAAAAPAAPAAPTTTIPSATNPVVQPLRVPAVPAAPVREPIAIPRAGAQ